MRILPLVGRKGEGKFTLVDADDFDRVVNSRWVYDLHRESRRSRPHSKTSSFAGRGNARLHRIVLQLNEYDLDGRTVTHWNGWGLDNRKQNLFVSALGRHSRGSRQNIHNVPPDGWKAFLGPTDLGTFPSRQEAEAAYETAAVSMGFITPSVKARLRDELLATLDALVQAGQLVSARPNASLIEDRYLLPGFSQNVKSKRALHVY